MLKVPTKYVFAAAVFAVVVPAPLASAAVQARSVPLRLPPLAKGTYVNITVPHGRATMAEEITDSGLIVGCYTSRDGRQRAFTDQGGTFTTLTHRSGGVASATTCALGVNNAGVIVGDYAKKGGPFHGFVYRHGAFKTINAPGAGRGRFQGTVAVGTNKTGVIVGYFITGKAVEHGFILRGGRFRTVNAPKGTGGTVLNGIADDGTISGLYLSKSGAHGFWLRRGVFHPVSVPGAHETEVACISERSRLLVGSYQVSGRRQDFGFTYHRGVYRTLRDPSATTGTVPQCGNDGGQVVGYYLGSRGEVGFEFTPAAATPAVVARPGGRAAPAGRYAFPPPRTGLLPLN